jgi:hypothetical protein
VAMTHRGCRGGAPHPGCAHQLLPGTQAHNGIGLQVNGQDLQHRGLLTDVNCVGKQ